VKKPNAVGANIFAGGFTLGVSKYFNILAHLEHDDYGVEVSKANFPKLPVFIGTETWPDKANKPIHFLYANPPCAIWSLAGNKHGRIDWRQDPRLQRVRDIFALAKRYRPQVWAWESVCQAFEKGRPFVEEIAAEAAKLGYSASYVMVDAMYLRAPQTRKRFFLVLHRVAIDWEKARPDFDAPPLLPREVLKGMKDDGTADREHGARTDIQKQMLKILKATPPGGRLAGTFNRVMKAQTKTARGTILGKPSFLAYRIGFDKIPGVIFGDKTFHPTEPRRLSLPELGAMHGFPRDYKWLSNKHRLDVQRGVLPPVGEWLGGVVAKAIKANRPIKKPDRTFVDFRRAPGSIQNVLALPVDADLNWKPERAARPAKGDRANAPAPTEPRARDRAPDTTKSRRRSPVETRAERSGRTRTGNKNPLQNKGLDNLGKVMKKPRAIKDLGDPKAIRADARAILGALARGERPRTSGALIRARILEGKLDDDAMATEVRKLWPGRTTSKSDVAWNRGMLKKGGVL